VKTSELLKSRNLHECWTEFWFEGQAPRDWIEVVFLPPKSGTTEIRLVADERGGTTDPYRAYFGIESPRRQITDLDKYAPFVQHRRF